MIRYKWEAITHVVGLERWASGIARAAIQYCARLSVANLQNGSTPLALVLYPYNRNLFLALLFNQHNDVDDNDDVDKAYSNDLISKSRVASKSNQSLSLQNTQHALYKYSWMKDNKKAPIAVE